MDQIVCNAPSFECTFSESGTDKSVIIGRHSHLVCEYIIIIEGNVSAIIENQTYKNLGPNHLIMIPPLTYHSITSEKLSRYRRITLQFHEDIIPEAIRKPVLERIADTPVIDLSSANYLTESLVQVLKTKNTPEYYPLIQSILIQLLYFSLNKTANNIVGGERDERLQSIIRFIDDNMKNIITLKNISEHTFLSVSTICHLFQSQMKTTVKQYVLQKKIYYASGLIRGGMPATKAASTIGYKNYADFYQIYRKITGLPPSSSKLPNSL